MHVLYLKDAIRIIKIKIKVWNYHVTYKRFLGRNVKIVTKSSFISQYDMYVTFNCVSFY